jgi:polygalacturonase
MRQGARRPAARERRRTNAFLSGPLELRKEVTLIVGGVTLFASRDPALYATSPGSCGIVNHPGAAASR